MVLIGWAVGFGLLAAGGVVALVGYLGGFNAGPIFVPLLALGGLIAFFVNVVGSFGAPKESAEIKAGYSTIGGHSNLDLVDEKTGDVIERGGVELPSARPVIIGQSEPRFERSWRRIGLVALATLAAVGAGVLVGAIRSAGRNVDPWSGLAGFLFTAGVVLIPVLVVLIALGAGTAAELRRMRTLRPDGRAIVSVATVDGIDALSRLGWTETIRWRFTVVADSHGISFWEFGGSEPRVSVSWRDVAQIEPGRAELKGTNGRSGRSIDVTIAHDGVGLLMPIPVQTWSPLVSPLRAANDALDDLRELRSARRA